jgi:PAS domain-containing protein
VNTRITMKRADLEQWKAREVARLLGLVETERRYYQEIVASIPVGLLTLSSDLSIISANRAIRKIFGLRNGDSLRGRLDSLLPSWVLDRVLEALKTGIAETDILVDIGRQGKHVRVGVQTIRNWDDEASQEALLTIEDLSGTEIAIRPQAAPFQLPNSSTMWTPLSGHWNCPA